MSKSAWGAQRQSNVRRGLSKLITAVADLKEGSENFEIALQFSTENVSDHSFPDAVPERVARTLNGILERLELHSMHSRSHALQSAMQDARLIDDGKNIVARSNSYPQATVDVLQVILSLANDACAQFKSSLKFSSARTNSAQARHQKKALERQILQEFADDYKTSQPRLAAQRESEDLDDDSSLSDWELSDTESVCEGQCSETSTAPEVISSQTQVAPGFVSSVWDATAFSSSVCNPVRYPAIGTSAWFAEFESAAELIPSAQRMRPSVLNSCLSRRSETGAARPCIHLTELELCLELFRALRGFPCRVFALTTDPCQLVLKLKENQQGSKFMKVPTNFCTSYISFEDLGVSSLSPDSLRSLLCRCAQLSSLMVTVRGTQARCSNSASAVFQCVGSFLNFHICQWSDHIRHLASCSSANVILSVSGRNFNMRDPIHVLAAMESHSQMIEDIFHLSNLIPSDCDSCDSNSALEVAAFYSDLIEYLNSCCLGSSQDSLQIQCSFLLAALQPFSRILDQLLFVTGAGYADRSVHGSNELLSNSVLLPSTSPTTSAARGTRFTTNTLEFAAQVVCNVAHFQLQNLATSIRQAVDSLSILLMQPATELGNEEALVLDCPLSLESHLCKVLADSLQIAKVKRVSFDITSLIAEAFVDPCIERCKQICSSCAGHFRSKAAGLNEFLSELQSVCFAADGETMQHLAQAVNHAISSKDSYFSKAAVASVLTKQKYVSCVFSSSQDDEGGQIEWRSGPEGQELDKQEGHERSLGVEQNVDSTANIGIGPAIDASRNVKLFVTPCWPLVQIISVSDRIQYQAVFRFLLSVRLAHESVLSVQPNPVFFKELPALEIQWRRLRILMLHLIQNLNNYATTRIVLGPDAELRMDILQAKSIFEIQTAHRKFLHSVCDRCLLNPKAEVVASALRKVLQLSIDAANAMSCVCTDLEAGSDMSSANSVTAQAHSAKQKLDGIEPEFEHVTLLLIVILKKIISIGFHPHIDDLVIRLDFNNFLSRMGAAKTSLPVN